MNPNNNVVPIRPSLSVDVATGRAKELQCVVISGYTKQGEFITYVGGSLDGRLLTNGDLMYIAETLKLSLLDGDWHE